ncbi:MAG: competence/damage-inducible protein A [Pseudomonadota bacterium]
MNADTSEGIVTAAMLAIGDELLSGRTRDKNIGHLATALTLQGIDLKEVRIVPDEENEIAAALNALRTKYTYVFTSGGIGPTHDDITADSVATAFGISIDHDPRAMAILQEHYQERELEFTTARKRMTRIPEGADLIPNKVSKAPGFILENVHVMAGVPSIFQAMLEEVLPQLVGGAKMLSEAVECEFGEGTIGDKLGEIQKANPDTSIGSYPRFDGERYSTQIVIRGRNHVAITAAAKQVETALVELRNR